MNQSVTPTLNLIMGGYSSQGMFGGRRARLCGKFWKTSLAGLASGAAGALCGAIDLVPANHQKMAENCRFWGDAMRTVAGSTVAGLMKAVENQRFRRVRRLIANLPNGRNGRTGSALAGGAASRQIGGGAAMIDGGLSPENGGFAWGVRPLLREIKNRFPVARASAAFSAKFWAETALPPMKAIGEPPRFWGSRYGVRGTGKAGAASAQRQSHADGVCALARKALGSGVLLGWFHPRAAQARTMAWGLARVKPN